MIALTGWDWYVLGVSVVSIGLGALRGLVRSVFALGAWIVAFLTAPAVGTFAIEAFSLNTGGPWVFLAAFVVVFAAVRAVGALAAGGLRRIGLGGADRLLGALMGTARAVLLVAVAVALAAALGWNREPAWLNAGTRPLLEALLSRIEPHLPERAGGVRRI